jgi:scyllo-inositol 2-dehydrogenase (NADP+)
MPAERPKAVVIGYGYAGRAFHSYLIGLDSGLELHGVASRSPETRARIVQERHCRAYESFEQVIVDPAVDLVVLATPNQQHAPYAIRVLEAGKHVVTDKPMCLDLAECDAMIAAGRRSGKVLSVFQNRRWDGDFLTLRDLLAQGTLGELRWLEMAWLAKRPPRGWRGSAEAGGGRLFDLGAHLLDQTLLLLPQAVTSVYCRMHHDYGEQDVESHAMVVLGFANGATAIVDTGGMHLSAKPRMQAFGTTGSFVKYGLDPQEAAMNRGDIDSAAEPPESYGKLYTPEGERVVPTLPGRWRNYYEMVAAQVQGRPTPVPPVRLEEARRVMAVLDAARESGRTGQVVRTEIAGL